MIAEKRRQHEIKLILLLAAVCLVVYAAAAIFLLTGTEEPSSDAKIRAISSPSEIEVSGADGAYLLRREKASWSCASEEMVPVNSTEISVMASSFGELTADRVIPDGSQYFSQFGLNDAAYRVTVRSSEEEKTWTVGGYNEILGQYYVTVDDGDTIYLVPKRQMEKCMKSLLNLVDTPGVDAMNSSEIKLYGVKTESESYRAYKSGDIYQYKVGKETHDGNGYLAEDIFFALKNIAYDNCVTYDASSAELRGYGLDRPDIRIDLTMNDDSVFTVKVAEAEDGTGYLNAWGNSIVYRITESELENLKEKIALRYQLAD